LRGGNAFSGNYKIRDITGVEIDSTDLGGALVLLQADVNGGPTCSLRDSRISRNTKVNGRIDINGSRGRYNVWVENNSGSGSIKYPCHVNLQNNSGFTTQTFTRVTYNAHPDIMIANPTGQDLYFNQVGGNQPFSLSNTLGNPVKYEVWMDAKKLDILTSLTKPVIVSLPSSNQESFVHFRAKDAGGYTAFSRSLQLQICDLNLTDVSLHHLQESLEIFPNPGKDEAFIRLPQEWKGDEFELIDIQGRISFGEWVSTEEKEFRLDLKGKPSGLYLIRMKPGKDFVLLKWIKE